MNNEFRILDVNDALSFRTIYEAINWCAGTNYTNWQRACWPSNKPKDGGFRMWFPKLSPIQNGKYIPLAFDCVNYLSQDWEYLYFDDLKERHNSTDPNDWYLGVDLIFAKDIDCDYVFRGVYKTDFEASRPNHFISKRIATRIKLIGTPARNYELIETDEDNTRDSINTPMRPKSIRPMGDDVQYSCGRCGGLFMRAPRCPECGQLVLE